MRPCFRVVIMCKGVRGLPPPSPLLYFFKDFPNIVLLRKSSFSDYMQFQIQSFRKKFPNIVILHKSFPHMDSPNKDPVSTTDVVISFSEIQSQNLHKLFLFKLSLVPTAQYFSVVLYFLLNENNFLRGKIKFICTTKITLLFCCCFTRPLFICGIKREGMATKWKEVE